jgi:hypothetical protein
MSQVYDNKSTKSKKSKKTKNILENFDYLARDSYSYVLEPTDAQMLLPAQDIMNCIHLVPKYVHFLHFY